MNIPLFYPTTVFLSSYVKYFRRMQLSLSIYVMYGDAGDTGWRMNTLLSTSFVLKTSLRENSRQQSIHSPVHVSCTTTHSLFQCLQHLRQC